MLQKRALLNRFVVHELWYMNLLSMKKIEWIFDIQSILCKYNKLFRDINKQKYFTLI